MSALHMTSVPVDLRELHRVAALRGHDRDEGRALHHFLSEAFGKGSLQPFRLMAARGARRATLYAYSRLAEAGLRDNLLDCAAPELLQTFDTEHLALKAMPESWRQGRRLAFDVRIRPVRRLAKPLQGWSREEHRRSLRGQPVAGPFKPGREVDAFLIERLRRYPDGLPEEGTEAAGPTREEVYFTWLAERLDGAATLDVERTRMAGFSRRAVQRTLVPGSLGDAATMSEGPDATFHGELTIVDGEAFARLLSSGVGRHTAYGYGMMLLRPPGG